MSCQEPVPEVTLTVGASATSRDIFRKWTNGSREGNRILRMVGQQVPVRTGHAVALRSYACHAAIRLDGIQPRALAWQLAPHNTGTLSVVPH